MPPPPFIVIVPSIDPSGSATASWRKPSTTHAITNSSSNLTVFPRIMGRPNVSLVRSIYLGDRFGRNVTAIREPTLCGATVGLAHGRLFGHTVAAEARDQT